jgi:sugar lactone lactonase YvrE
MTRDMQDEPVAVCVVGYKNILGEVPDWDVTEQALYWVDIEGCLLQRLIPATGATRSWRLRERICALALRESGGMLLALASGFVFFDAGTMGLRRLAATRAAGSGPVRWMTSSQRRRGRSIVSMPISAAIAWNPASAFRAVLPGARTKASSTSPTRYGA